jgi:predicted NAD/FAD-binding protein
MNILQGVRSRHTFCVTLNNESRIKPELVVRRFEYQHPVFTTQRRSAQARHAEVISANRTSFCGAYWRNGFHEDGVVSALAVVNALRQNASDSGFVSTLMSPASPVHKNARSTPLAGVAE